MAIRLTDSENIVTFTVGVGDRVKITRPLGYPPVEYSSSLVLDEAEIYRVFRVINTDLGVFEGGPAGDPMSVYYRHQKSGRQVIQYISDGLVMMYFYAILDGITVHDHASVPQGGPAFATYYSDNLASRREEESS
jgi:hypothetical protein